MDSRADNNSMPTSEQQSDLSSLPNSLSHSLSASSTSQNLKSPVQGWSKESVRQLRLRMGWSRTDLARRLKCSPELVESFEDGVQVPESFLKSEIEILLRHAEACSDEVRLMPSAENQCDKDALQQIDFSRVKAEFE